jgi:defect-in-organelle-trafficking protein DotC
MDMMAHDMPSSGASAPVAQQVQTVQTPAPLSLAEVLSLRATGAASPTEKQGLRERAIRSAAQTYAAQNGYCAEVNALNAQVMARSAALDGAFNFASLLLDGGRVLPPVIEQADASFATTGPDYAITTQKIWKIIQPPMIISAAPTWRQYLIATCPTPLPPNPVLLPRSQDDVAAWEKGAKEGWDAGVEQARMQESLALARLVRDYTGMLRFAVLHARGLVSAPILATGQTAVVVDGKTLRVGETIFRLTRDAEFNPAQARLLFGSQAKEAADAVQRDIASPK